MNNLNSVLIEGNLVNEPVIRSTDSGTSVCLMRIATNRCYKTSNHDLENEVSFFEVESWSRLAEACFKNSRKGRGVRVIGRLKEDRWNGTDGKPFSRITIIAEHVEFRPEFTKQEEDEVEDFEQETFDYSGQ